MLQVRFHGPLVADSDPAGGLPLGRIVLDPAANDRPEHTGCVSMHLVPQRTVATARTPLFDGGRQPFRQFSRGMCRNRQEEQVRSRHRSTQGPARRRRHLFDDLPFEASCTGVSYLGL